MIGLRIGRSYCLSQWWSIHLFDASNITVSIADMLGPIGFLNTDGNGLYRSTAMGASATRKGGQSRNYSRQGSALPRTSTLQEKMISRCWIPKVPFRTHMFSWRPGFATNPTPDRNRSVIKILFSLWYKNRVLEQLHCNTKQESSVWMKKKKT